MPNRQDWFTSGVNELGELAKACHRSNSSTLVTNGKVHGLHPLMPGGATHEPCDSNS